MSSQAPKIDPRTYQQLVERAAELATRYSGWRPRDDGAPDGGTALIRIFARLAELLIERVNRVPEKNLLAFLDMIGTQVMPPQPARVPLTFSLAPGGAGDSLVPARTRVAAVPIAGDPGPVVFETEEDLVVTRSQLAAVFVREPGRDRFSGDLLLAGAPFAAFSGERPTAHRLYLGHAGQFGLAAAQKAITLRFTPAEGAVSWLSAVRWERWDGAGYVPVAQGEPALVGGGWEVTLSGLPAIPLSGPNVGAETLSGPLSAWLRGVLTRPLPRNGPIEGRDAPPRPALWRAGLAPDRMFSDAGPLVDGQLIRPFGAASIQTAFYLASDEAFSADVAVSIDLMMDAAQPAQPGSDLELAWEYWDGATWRELGRSRPWAAAPEPTPQGFVDESRAFTRDGPVSFVCPADWQSLALNGETRARRWLRARIAAGSYKAPAGYRPPAVAALSIAYGDLPRVSSIQTRVGASARALAPDLAAANQLVVDLSKDFFPFGERPRFNDTLYLASEEAFGRPGADVTLTIALTNPGDEKVTPLPAVSNGAELAWEYWDREALAWKDLQETDGSKAFTADKATVKFAVPPTAGPVEVNGERRSWLRVRLARGNYGTEAAYTPVINPETKQPRRDANGLIIYEFTPASFRPPSIKQVTIDYAYTSAFTPLDYALAENDFAVEELGADRGRAARTPFTPMQGGARPALYLGFRRPGAASGFANRTTCLYVAVDDVLYGQSAGPGGGRAMVTWEYWGGDGWRRLGTRDETRGFTRRGLITFVGPEPFPARADFGLAEPLFWLRAVWESGGYASPPRLSRVLTNTTWAAHRLTIVDEILGASNGEPGQRLQATHAPVLAGQVLEVREPEQPSAGERAELLAEEGPGAVSVVPGADGRPAEIWVRWHETPDFYGSGPRSRHYTLDRQTGEVRFGDGLHGLVPPRGRANIRLTRYTIGGGLAGNRPAGNLTRLKTTVPQVDRVTNPEPAGGGAEGEALEAVLRRGPRTLRHRDRAVAIADYEDLAILASPDVALVRGIAATDSGDAGTIDLIVVPRAAAARPVPSVELLARVEAHLRERMDATAELRVRGPDWLRVSVAGEVVPSNLDAAADVQTAVLARLARFLHPLTGGLDGTGWAFGRKPYRSDLFALVERTPGVSHVRRLQVDEQPDGDSFDPDRFLVYSGDHTITMAGAADPSDI